jgi:hypothetical protein
MELDDLKSAWADHGARLERSLAIDERILRELVLGKVRRALVPFVLARALEVLLGGAALAGVLPILVAHRAEPLYLGIGAALVLFALGLLAQCANLLLGSLQLDYAGAVTALQTDLERLRRAEYRAFKWALFGGTLLWLPILLVLFEFVTGVDALARVAPSFLAGNLVFGALFLWLGQTLSKRLLERASPSPRARWFLEGLASGSLRRSRAHLEELARFTRE